MATIECELCIVGAGIAGASLAARIAPHRSVVLLEREAQPGYHSTGRSVAIFTHTLPGVQVAPLTRASRAFFQAPPPGFSETPLTRPRAVLLFGDDANRTGIDALYAGLRGDDGKVRMLDGEAVRAMVPILRPEHAAVGMLDEDAFEIDVDALLQGWLRQMRAAGGRLLTGASVSHIARVAGAWDVRAGETEVRAQVLVNAAGAWADEVAKLAGIRGLGLSPRRRTVAVVAANGLGLDHWPMCVAADHGLYFKPDTGRLLVSAMEETPSPPCDATVDDLEVAIALDRLETVTGLAPRRPLQSWAGLRSFVPDGEPVAGPAPDEPSFFWLAGQGGAGIQTVPALSEAAASLLRGVPLPDALVGLGVSQALLAPERLPAASGH